MTEQLVREKKYPDAVHMVARVIVSCWVEDDQLIPPAWIGVIEKGLRNGVQADETQRLFIDGAATLSAIPRYRVDAAKGVGSRAQAQHSAQRRAGDVAQLFNVA